MLNNTQDLRLFHARGIVCITCKHQHFFCPHPDENSIVCVECEFGLGNKLNWELNRDDEKIIELERKLIEKEKYIKDLMDIIKHKRKR